MYIYVDIYIYIIVPRGSKYQMFEVSGLRSHANNSVWDQSLEILGTWTLWIVYGIKYMVHGIRYLVRRYARILQATVSGRRLVWAVEVMFRRSFGSLSSQGTSLTQRAYGTQM